ncbi:MAG: MarC family protein [Candidatus Symbiodolus clandestinus]
MFETLLSQVIVLSAVIDPIGTIPVYLAKTASFSPVEQGRIAKKAILIATIILLFFLFAGKLTLEQLDIEIAAFQVAGGLILFLFALTMVFGESKPHQEIQLESEKTSVAVFPIAVPSIASPGAMMTLVLLSDKDGYVMLDYLGTTVALFSVLLVTYLLLLVANDIQRWIRLTGAAVISRVMGLILAAVAINNVLFGLQNFFSTSFV